MDENGIPCNPSGKLIPMHHKVPHLQCVKSRVGDSPKEQEIAIRSLVENKAEQVAPSDAVDSLGAHLFAFTLTDNRQDPNSQANKLWASQEDFQHDVNAWVLSDVVVPSFNDIATSFTHLTPNPDVHEASMLGWPPQAHLPLSPVTHFGVPADHSPQYEHLGTQNFESIATTWHPDTKQE